MDLQEPESRMSTSFSSDLGIVKVLDPPDMIRRKVRSAVTDSGRDVVRAEDKPGVTNLIEIMAVATGEAPEAIEARYDGAGYGKFKEEVAEAVVELFDPIRLRYAELRGDPDELRAILAQRRREGARDRRRDARARPRARRLRRALVFVAPDGSYTATYPRLLRRVGAGAFDWVLCWVIFLVASIVGGILQTVASAPPRGRRRHLAARRGAVRPLPARRRRASGRLLRLLLDTGLDPRDARGRHRARRRRHRRSALLAADGAARDHRRRRLRSPS